MESKFIFIYDFLREENAKLICDNIFSGAARRKKKKPTTFVPPPNLSITQTAANGSSIPCTTSITGLMSIPFWRRPVSQSQTGGS